MRKSILALAPALLSVVVATAGCQDTTGGAAALGSDGGPAAPVSGAASTGSSAGSTPTSVAPTEVPHSVASRPASGLVIVGGAVLPNRTLTPGATNPAVTQATIRTTICLTGYTKTIRPSSTYTTALKRHQLATGYAYRGDQNTSDYEEDHLISLELGGSPAAVKNLWPEPYAATEGARVKDKIENKLHDLVCSGHLSLRAAQRAIAVNWWKAFQQYGGWINPPPS